MIYALGWTLFAILAGGMQGFLFSLCWRYLTYNRKTGEPFDETNPFADWFLRNIIGVPYIYFVGFCSVLWVGGIEWPDMDTDINKMILIFLPLVLSWMFSAGPLFKKVREGTWGILT